MSEPGCVRIAAAGDVHVEESNRDRVAAAFAALNEQADLVLIAGDLTTHGEPEQGELFARCRREAELPVIAVLGNHDWHAGRRDELVQALTEGDVKVLDGAATSLEVAGATVGVAGAKGFVGGFEPGSYLPDFGEPLLRTVYAATGAEATLLDRALAAIAGCDLRVALLHYAPIQATLAGEPPGIHTFLGSGRLAEPIARHRPDLALHGHAHAGTLEGDLDGVPVYNVSVPVMQRDFWVFELRPVARAEPAEVEVEPAR